MKETLNKEENKKQKKTKMLTFPAGFLWGVAYSSMQVEGDVKNSDWWRWAEEGKTKDKIDKACDSWNRYEEDHQLAENLGCGGFRMSLEWSRIEPNEGEFSQEALAHYKKILQNIKKRGMKRVVTLWHWGLPLWFADNYGWHKKESVEYFARYCQKVIDELGDEIDVFLTLNEPTIPLNKGYLVGIFPPGKINPWYFYRARQNMIKAHEKCYKLIKEAFPRLPVGITQFCNTFESRGFLKKIFEKFQDFYNWGFVKSGQDYHDFIGIDYYATFEPRIIPPSVKRKTIKNRWTDMGWGIYPQGIYDICLDAHKKFKKPIYILENGLADEKDKYRADFIREHLEKLQEAIKDGVDLKGYFYWSLLDNFEWNWGYGPKFGLCEMDYKTMERKPRKSYFEYRKIIKNNGISS